MALSHYIVSLHSQAILLPLHLHLGANRLVLLCMQWNLLFCDTELHTMPLEHLQNLSPTPCSDAYARY